VALSSWARASLRYRIARALLMASQIPRNRRRIQVQEKDLVPGSAGEAVPGSPIRLSGAAFTDSLQNPDSRAGFPDSCRGHPERLGCLSVIYLPQSSSCQSLLAEVRPRLPLYLRSISRALCSAGMRCIKPLAPSRSETNSSRVNGGADEPWSIPRTCAYGWPVQASHPATIKLTHYLDGARRGAFAEPVSRRASHRRGDTAARVAARSRPGARSQ
jgi:hypothetical protein